MNWLVEKGAAVLAARTSRRGFLVKAAVAGTALAVSPLQYLLKPGSAYAHICGCAGHDCDCGSACCDGYSAFCCEVNGGVNACPAGTFAGGWWRADGSIFCGGTRYIVDCNSYCDAEWPGCGCAQGDCDRRRTGCNFFRYGQCNQHIECFGPIVCRMATCEPPYQLDLGCSDETFWDNSTANHGADCSSSGGGGRGGGGSGGRGGPDPGPPPADDGLTGRERERQARSEERQAERAARSAEREAELEARRAERANRSGGQE